MPQIQEKRDQCWVGVCPELSEMLQSRAGRSENSVLPLWRPDKPSDHHDGLENNSSPKSSNKSDRAMRPHATDSRAPQKQDRSGNPAVALGVVFQAEFE